MEKKRLKNLVYMGYQYSLETRSLHHLRRPPAPLEYWRVPRLVLPITWNLKARAKLAGLASIHTPDGNSGRKTENKKEQHGGISLSRNRSDFFIFRFAYIPFVAHRDKWKF